MSWTIREPRIDDVEEMGRVHVRVWQEAYAGLMPADYLAALDPARSTARMREWVEAPAPGVVDLVARDEQGVVGLATSGPARDEDAPTGLQLYAINVLARAHGTGLAHDLLVAAIGDLPAYLWVVEGNDRAIAFYAKHGFATDGGRDEHPPTGTSELRMTRGPQRR